TQLLFLLAMRSGRSPLGLRATLMAGEAALALPAVLAAVLWRGSPLDVLALRAAPRRAMMVAAVAGATLWAASLGLMQVQAWLWPPSEAFLALFRQLHAALRPQGAFDALVSIAAIALFPATCEEVVFRGAVLPSLLRRLGATGAVAVSAVLFGLIHLDAAPGASALFRVPFAVFVGAGLGVLRIVSGSLVAPILAHAVLNTITFSTVLFTGAADQPIEDARPAVGAAMLVGGTAFTLLLFRFMRRPLTAPDPARLAT
ncbi:MAG TPA: CPBP family intramembrane glutamic endopeptidase, partial [Vicinamibacteria bacterium]|nr:CPBP family intramembrane glutamic endopeptidase [Vicinamibacteria bacterium]